MTILEIITRMTIAFICGCAIGSERQIHHRTAGLKTNALVALGACAFTLFDLMNHLQFGADLRVSAQIVSGIGFIGGGVILKDGFNIKGLTTAATLWCSAAAGMMAGTNHLWEAAIISLFVMTINTFLRPIVSLLNNVENDEIEYIIKASCNTGQEDKIKKIILNYIDGKRINLKNIRINKQDTNKKFTEIDALLIAKNSKKIEGIAHNIAKNSEVHSASWEALK